MFCAYCGLPVEPGFRFCASCGNPCQTDRDEATARPRRLITRGKMAGAAAAALIATGVYLYNDTRPAFGPASAAEVQLTLAPGVSAQILPSHSSLADARFEAFDVAPDGRIVVSIGSRLFELESGRPLFLTDQHIRAFAFVEDALVATNGFGELGYYDDGEFKPAGQPGVPQTGLRASSDRRRLFLYRRSEWGLGDAPALASLSSGAPLESLTGSVDPITSVGGDAYRTYFSIEDALFQIVTPGHPSLVFALPEQGHSITGIEVTGEATYFSTDRAVYSLQELFAAPVVVGIGGEIRVVNGVIYVLDSRQGRLYTLTVAGEGATS